MLIVASNAIGRFNNRATSYQETIYFCEDYDTEKIKQVEIYINTFYDQQ
jgi:hypothetical protein